MLEQSAQVLFRLMKLKDFPQRSQWTAGAWQDWLGS